MRTAKVITEINKPTIIEISGYGQTSFVRFAEKCFMAGLIDFKTRLSANKISFTDRFATELLNKKPELFPAEF